jgi:predicted nucleotidyltransferase
VAKPKRMLAAVETPSEQIFMDVLADAVRVVEETGLPYGLMGGIGSALHGRPRWTHDIDLFVRPGDAPFILDAFTAAGFRTERKNPQWLFKAFKKDVLVDILFRAMGDIYLDEEMSARIVEREFKGLRLKVIPPEDLIVIKAIVHDEETPRHWYDALGMLVRADLDWEYLLRRAQYGPRRLLSLLVYAQSIDLVVPDEVIGALHETIYRARGLEEKT